MHTDRVPIHYCLQQMMGTNLKLLSMQRPIANRLWSPSDDNNCNVRSWQCTKEYLESRLWKLNHLVCNINNLGSLSLLFQPLVVRVNKSVKSSAIFQVLRSKGRWKASTSVKLMQGIKVFWANTFTFSKQNTLVGYLKSFYLRVWQIRDL